MYYSFKCTYCGRLFYTYNFNKQRASEELYSTVKQHLIDSGEDEKEYEMDDGATEDSNQIYSEMTVSDHRPAGGFEATPHTGLRSSSHTVKPTTHVTTAAKKHTTESPKHSADEPVHHAHSSYKLTIFLLFIAIALIILIFFMLTSQGMLQLIIPQF